LFTLLVKGAARQPRRLLHWRIPALEIRKIPISFSGVGKKILRSPRGLAPGPPAMGPARQTTPAGERLDDAVWRVEPGES
jgi:hypothetical protein